MERQKFLRASFIDGTFLQKKTLTKKTTVATHATGQWFAFFQVVCLCKSFSWHLSKYACLQRVVGTVLIDTRDGVASNKTDPIRETSTHTLLGWKHPNKQNTLLGWKHPNKTPTLVLCSKFRLSIFSERVFIWKCICCICIFRKRIFLKCVFCRCIFKRRIFQKGIYEKVHIIFSFVQIAFLICISLVSGPIFLLRRGWMCQKKTTWLLH